MSTTPKRERMSRKPWSYGCRTQTLPDGRESIVYKVIDAKGNTVLEGNNELPADMQKSNARLAAAAPELSRALRRCIDILADYHSYPCDERNAQRQCIKAYFLGIEKEPVNLDHREP